MPTKTKAADEVIEETEAPVKNEYVQIFVPKEHLNQGDLEVFVNFKAWTVKRGQFVMVPREVAEAITNATAMQEKAYAYMEEAQKPKEIGTF